MVWLMIKGGATDQQIIDGMKIKDGTLDRVKRSNGDYKLYKSFHANEVLNMVKYSKDKKEKNETIVHEQSVKIVADEYMAAELKKQTALLELISRKMAFIVDELVGTEKQAGQG